MKTAGAVVVAILLIAAICVGGWLGGWWLQADATNRTTGIANTSLARQQALLDEVTDKAADIRRIDVQLEQTPSDAVGAQRIAIVDQFCQAYGGLTGRLQVPVSVDALATQECA